MRGIPPLYHWSPTVNRDAILTGGLRPTCQTGRHGLTVCLASTPAEAWALALTDRWPGPWDLWQVHVADTPVRRIRHWGRLVEWRIARPIAPHGVVWVASRDSA